MDHLGPRETVAHAGSHECRKPAGRPSAVTHARPDGHHEQAEELAQHATGPVTGFTSNPVGDQEPPGTRTGRARAAPPDTVATIAPRFGRESPSTRSPAYAG